MVAVQNIRTMLAHWGMEREKLADFYYVGTDRRADNVWKVDDDYLIKIGTNTAGLDRHIAIARAMTAQGLGVNLPIQTIDGRDYVFDGELYYCLTRSIEGAPLPSASFYREDCAVDARALGGIVAGWMGSSPLLIGILFAMRLTCCARSAIGPSRARGRLFLCPTRSIDLFRRN